LEVEWGLAAGLRGGGGEARGGGGGGAPCRAGGVLAAVGQQDLTDSHPCANSLGLAECSPHPGLQPICSGARQHLVDAQNVEGVHAHAQVEGVLPGILDHVFVGGNAGGLESLTGHLLLLPTANDRDPVSDCCVNGERSSVSRGDDEIMSIDMMDIIISIYMRCYFRRLQIAGGDSQD
jgi:hypothetical protein